MKCKSMSAMGRVFVGVTTLVVAFGCQSDGREMRRPDIEFPAAETNAVFEQIEGPESTTPVAAPSPATERALLPVGTTTVFAFADRTGEPLATLTVPNEFQAMTALPVLQRSEDGTAVAVSLPGKDAAPAGWIAADGLVVDRAPQSVVVDRQRLTLTLYEGGDVLLAAPVLIGPEYERLVGTSEFVMAVLGAPDAPNELGAFGIAGSKSSTSVGAFIQGPNQVVIHGRTNDQETVTPVGTVSLEAAKLEQLTRVLQLGTTIQFLA